MLEWGGGAETAATAQIDTEAQKDAVQAEAITSLQNYQKELLGERERQSRIKEKYGIRSLKKLIEDLDSELMYQRTRQWDGANVDIVIHNKEERQKQYIESEKRLATLIKRQKSLTISKPKFVGIVKVVPSGTIPDAIKENTESEKAAMNAAMLFEKKHGRNPIDVSKKVGLGYDIKSTSEGKIRYIEVKGRHKEGDVSLTCNEWFKARQLGKDYYLYVVWNTGIYSTERLQPMVIQDPASTLVPKTDVHYVIKAEEVKKVA